MMVVSQFFCDDSCDDDYIDGDTIGVADVTGSVTDSGRLPEESENGDRAWSKFPQNPIILDKMGFASNHP